MRLILKSASITCLVFAGLTYCLAGMFGLIPNGKLIEAAAWSLLISPYVWVSYLNSHGTSYHVISMQPHPSFSRVAIAVGVIAMVASIGLAWSSKLAYWTWIILLIIGGISVVGYVVASAADDNLGVALILTCWELSYIGAFLLATKESEEADSLGE